MLLLNSASMLIQYFDSQNSSSYLLLSLSLTIIFTIYTADIERVDWIYCSLHLECVGILIICFIYIKLVIHLFYLIDVLLNYITCILILDI